MSQILRILNMYISLHLCLKLNELFVSFIFKLHVLCFIITFLCWSALNPFFRSPNEILRLFNASSNIAFKLNHLDFYFDFQFYHFASGFRKGIRTDEKAKELNWMSFGNCVECQVHIREYFFYISFSFISLHPTFAALSNCQHVTRKCNFLPLFSQINWDEWSTLPPRELCQHDLEHAK